MLNTKNAFSSFAVDDSEKAKQFYGETLGLDMRYRSFLSELEALLTSAGIVPLRRPICAKRNPKKSRSIASGPGSQQLGRVTIYVEEHLTEQLSLELLDEEAQLSKYQLIRRFQNEKEITPWKYVISKRIEKAKQLLEEGQSPGQVAAETCFYDQSHFSKSFRKETGQTPREYQEENIQNRN